MPRHLEADGRGQRGVGKFLAELAAGLVQYAASYFDLDLPGKDGSTKRDKLNRAATSAFSTAKAAPAELEEEPELPPLAAHLWHWWLELNGSTGGNGFSQNPISYTEIKNWSELTGNQPEPWEVAAIRAIDRAYLNREKEK